jgi:hypothetical protein
MISSRGDSGRFTGAGEGGVATTGSPEDSGAGWPVTGGPAAGVAGAAVTGGPLIPLFGPCNIDGPFSEPGWARTTEGPPNACDGVESTFGP